MQIAAVSKETATISAIGVVLIAAIGVVLIAVIALVVAPRPAQQ
jgi:hypothetical protein